MPLSRFVLAGVVLVAIIGYNGPPALRAQDQPPVFRAGTTLVEVDVVVRDGKRQFVADLRAEDFEVRDDGVPQEVSVFYRVLGPGEQVAAPAPGAPPAVAPPLPPPQQVQRVLVFYFDPHHIQPGAFDRARNAALQFLQNDFREGDVGGVVANGKMLNGRLTSSRDELAAALRSAKPEAAASLTRELREWPRFVDIMEAYRLTRREAGMNPGPTVLDDVVERACRERPEDCRGPGRAAVEAETDSKATQLVANERIASKQVLDSISALANGLAKLPGRKTLILVTEGFFVENALTDVRVVVGRAARASVRIYALDSSRAESRVGEQRHLHFVRIRHSRSCRHRRPAISARTLPTAWRSIPAATSSATRTTSARPSPRSIGTRVRTTSSDSEHRGRRTGSSTSCPCT